MKQYIFILLAAFVFSSFTTDKPAYLLYNQDGKKVKYSKMIKAFEDADIIFFGELHTDPIAHWMQFELTKELYNMKQDALIIGAEMFESDNQLILSEYLDGLYKEDKFKVELKLWKNYETDYKPVVEFAKENNIPYIATNIPRRYANMVLKMGFESLDSLTDEAKKYIAPLPILYDPEVMCYKKMLSMDTPVTIGEIKMIKEDSTTVMEEEAMPGKEMGMKDLSSHSMENLPKAQAAKDATMAHFILENWSEGKTMFHFNGSWHSNNHEGIVWHLKQQNKDLKIVTIATVLQDEIAELDDENVNIADFILCVPKTMTRTSR